jgi:hypothetical protein
MSEVMDCISKKLPSSSSGVQAEGKLLQCVSGLLIAMLRSDPGLDAPPGVVESAQGGAYDDLIAWYIQTVQEEESAKQSAKQAGVDLKDGDVLLLDWTFQQLNVHAALTPSEIEAELRPTIQRGWRLTELARLLNSRKHADVKLCIFLDEVNTSQCMGVFKELVVDRRLNGEDLPDNIVVIAACNPARDRLSAKAADARRVELGKEWAMGHYQVHPLPLSIEQVVWNFGSLTETQESEFVSKRMVLLDDLPAHEHSALLGLICQSQILIRKFAYQHIGQRVADSLSLKWPNDTEELGQDELRARVKAALGEDVEKEIEARASSVVSLRDIQRVFTLFKWFNALLQLRIGQRRQEDITDLFFFSEDDEEDGDRAQRQLRRRRRSMLLTVGVVYYLRLSPEYRARFEQMLHSSLSTEREEGEPLSEVLDEVMKGLLDNTELEKGIARTQGLKENIFMTIVCCCARIPLTVIGPPGSSKTLSVTVVTENAKGKQSRSESFYRTQKRLVPFHYQCSRRSTSREIEAVFKRAIDTQKDSVKDSLCFGECAKLAPPPFFLHYSHSVALL